MRKDIGGLAAGKLYDALRKSGASYYLFPKDVGEDIRVMGLDEREYYLQKLKYALCVGGVVVLLLVAGVVYLATLGDELTSVERPMAYEEEDELLLYDDLVGGRYRMEVSPIQWSKEQAEAQFEELSGMMQGMILGENECLERVEHPLYLPEQVEGYPFDIFWESDKEQVVDTLGKVHREGLSEDTIVEMTAVYYYGEWMWQESFAVVVMKESLSEQEAAERSIEEHLALRESSSVAEASFELPADFQGRDIHFYPVRDDYSLILLSAVVMVAGICLWMGRDYDVRSLRGRRQQFFRAEYEHLLGSLSLYITAGKTLPGAMLQCVRDYEKHADGEHLLLQALQEYQKDMENGYSFGGAIARFADRCDHREYKKLALTLTQGTINGTQGLAQALQKEVNRIREEKKRQCRVQGEKISTALIAPMMVQLGMIIVLIMIPAFTNMQI